jgi:hypothetical protein
MSLEDSMKMELEEILSAMGTEDFDAAAKERLGTIVGESEEARQIYLDHCQMHAMLRESSLLAAFNTEPMPNVVPMAAASSRWPTTTWWAMP